MVLRVFDAGWNFSEISKKGNFMRNFMPENLIVEFFYWAVHRLFREV